MTVRRGVEASGCLPFRTAENDRRPGRPKRGPCHGLGAQGLPAGERATELSYAPRVFIAGRAWLERGHSSQVA